MYNVGTVVIGTGFIGPAHVEALKRLGINVVGIFDVVQEKARQEVERFGLEKVYGSFDEVLLDDQVSVVHITTPNRFHFEMARTVLNAGKNVLCEKPLAMNSEESAELVELAKKTGKAAAVNYNVRFYPLNLEARDMVKRGDVGEVYSIFGSYVQDWLFYPTDYNWRVLADQGGDSRAVADVGTHWLDLAHSITGLEVEAVCADLKTVYPVRQRPKGEVETYTGKLQKEIETEPVEITTEDAGCVMLRFQGGARGCLWVSQVTAGRKNCLKYEIAGSKCALSWCSEQPNEMWIGHRDKANEIMMRDPALVADMPRSYINFPGGHNEGFPDTFKQSFRAFYEYIDTGDFSAVPAFPTFADGHREILLCEAILKSNRESRWIEL
ncbi:Gfo/Idh/MocA family protein [Candidatus Poribacteria bacterium]